MLKLILKGLLSLVILFLVISHLWFSIIVFFLCIAIFVYAYNKGKDKEEKLGF